MDAGDDLITLDEAAKLIPGADANTLKRLQRKGVLRSYRPGKAYLTTAADVREAVKKCQGACSVGSIACGGQPDVPEGTEAHEPFFAGDGRFESEDPIRVAFLVDVESQAVTVTELVARLCILHRKCSQISHRYPFNVSA